MADENVMAFLSNRVEREDLLPGHHIYTWRNLSTYAHHGIYVGNNMVIHFGIPGLPLSSSSLSSPFCPTCPQLPSRGNGVKRSCLDCFLRNDSLYLYRYGVSNWYYNLTRGGTCTTAMTSPPDVVVSRAEYLFEHGFGEYHVMRNNCEDFALYCKTGKLVRGGIGCSGQAWNFRLPFSIRRHRHDIGRRQDAEDVELENVSDWHSRNAIADP